MRARRLTAILPAMTLAEAIETMRINHVAGLIDAARTVVTTWTFRAPHHTISDVGLIGGCLVTNVSRLSSPHACALVPVHGQAAVIVSTLRRGPARLAGEMSRAHPGGLALEACPECRRYVLRVVDRQG
jgi:predicted ATPase with chaperone activity